LPSSSISQPSGTFSRLVVGDAQLALRHRAGRHVEQEGGSPGSGMAMQHRVGAEARVGAAVGATRACEMHVDEMDRDQPSATAISAQWPMRPRWCELPSAMMQVAVLCARSIAIASPRADGLAVALAAVEREQRAAVELTFGCWLARARPRAARRRSAESCRCPCESWPQQVGHDQVLGDQPASRGSLPPASTMASIAGDQILSLKIIPL
jgi:hypothetical protein